MDVALYISRKLRLNVAGQRRSPSVGIAVCGIAIAVVVMMLTIAIVTGFKHQITDKVMGFDSQITLTPLATDYQEGVVMARLSDGLRQVVTENLPQGATVTLSERRPAVLKTEDAFEAIALEGYSEAGNYGFVSGNITGGKMPSYTGDDDINDIVISAPVASRLGLSVGDRVSAFFFSDEGGLRLRRLSVAAIYETHFGEYDNAIGFASMRLLQGLGASDDDSASTIRIDGLATDDIRPATDALNDALAQGYYTGRIDRYYVARNVYQNQPTYFGWLELLDTNVLVILILMGCVSGFTLVSCLFILILERVRMIGVLKAMGATNALIRRVFIYLALRVILLGVVIGDIVALALIIIQDMLHVMKLNPEAYCLSYVPVDLSVTAFVLLNIAVVAVALLLLLVPSHIISRLSPARVVRYE